MKRALIIPGLILGLVLAWGMVSLAQPPDPPRGGAGTATGDAQDPQAEGDEGNGFLLNFIQGLLSAPGREVRIRGVSGVLASQATIGEITVADADGVWLAVRNVTIDWRRRALFLRRLSVNELTIGSIDYSRPPLPPEPTGPRLADAEARPFTLPELPLQVLVDALRIERLRFGEPVLGQPAELEVAGSLTLIRGALDSDLRITRLDDPGGELSLRAAFSNVTRELELDLTLREPPGGIVTTALNIQGRPAIELSLQGQGPLENVDLELALDADGVRLAAGDVALRDTPEGLAFVADFVGELAPLVPPDYGDFFAGRTRVRAAGVSLEPAGLRIDELAVEGAALALEGALALGPDGFLQRLELAGDIGDRQGPPVTLPVPGGQTSLHWGTLHVSYGEGSRWDGRLVLDRLRTGDIELADLTLTMGGLAENLQDPARRNVTIVLEGVAIGISAEDPAVREALGERIELLADIALPPDAPIEVRRIRIDGAGLAVLTAGTIEDLVYSGRHEVRIANLAPLSGLAGRDLAGAIDLRATGDISLASGGFDLTLEGGATDLQVGEPQIDPLLAGETELSGRVRRDETGLYTDDFRIENPQLAFTSTGRVSSEETDIGFEARLADLALVAEEASGAVTARGRAEGRAGAPINLSLEAAIPEGRLVGQPLAGIAVAFKGAWLDGDLTGRIDGTGRLSGGDIALTGDLGLIGDRRSLQDFRLAVGPNRIVGDLLQRGEAPIEGRLEIKAPDLAPLAAFALTEAEGAVEAVVELGPAEVGQGLSLRASLRDVVFEDNRIAALDLQAEVGDAFGVPLADATVSGTGIAAAGVEIDRLEARAGQTSPTTMAFESEARLAIGTEATLAGGLERLADGFALTLERLALVQEGIKARLVAPATIRLADDAVTLTPLALELGGGRLEAEGRMGEAIDIALIIDRLPLELVNTIQPGLGLTGTVDGTARVNGPREAPRIAFDLNAAGVGAAPVRAAGLPVFDLAATGATEDGRLNLDARLSSPAGIAARATGAVLIGTGGLDLAIDLGALPLAPLDALAGGIGLQGSLTGNARVTGTLGSPAAEFSLTGTGIGAAVLRENLVPPLGVAATGAFADGVLRLARATVTGPGEIALSAAGTIPLEGPGLALSLAGNVPLGLADAALAERGAQLAGRGAFDLAVGGSLASPTVTGPVSIPAATFIDPQTNIRIEGIQLAARLDGDGIVIDRLTGRSAFGGTLATSGRIGILAPGLPADLQVTFTDLVYTDGTFVSTRLNGALAVSGPLTAPGGLVQGAIDLGTTEILVAEGLGGAGGGVLEEVTHRNVPPAVARTLERAGLATPAPAQATAGPAFGVDILVRATRIFIRGRGLDVEVGGELRLRGTTNDLAPVGEFRLRRGRLTILGQRIDFEQGSVRLVGNLDPQINFTAQTVTDEATAIVRVSGRASEPDISFSSVPPLPEDEVLALIIFNRTSQQLSPFQIAQLASAAAELTGAGGNGLLARFRGAIGLADLDIVAGEAGGTAVRAGRYIDDNIYLDVQAGSGADTRVNINLDITTNVTVQGSVDADGNSRVGVFYTRDR